MFKLIKKKQNKGFTLIEMLVAVFIFSVALTALIKVSARGLRSAKNAEQHVVAEFLSLEGLERVRAYRDTQFLQNQSLDSWDDIVNPACQPTATSTESNIVRSPACQYSDLDLAVALTITPCTDNCKIKQIDSNGSYVYTSGLTASDTEFTRKMYFIIPNQADGSEGSEMMVESRVSWVGGEVSYYDSLFLWNS